jgi:hypothetical protein
MNLRVDRARLFADRVFPPADHFIALAEHINPSRASLFADRRAFCSRFQDSESDLGARGIDVMGGFKRSGGA